MVVLVLIRCIVILWARGSPLSLSGCLFGSESFARDTRHTTSVVALMEDAGGGGVDPNPPTRVASLVCHAHSDDHHRMLRCRRLM